MRTCTAIIPRPADAPPIRVLEVDGPFYRRRPVQRGEGSYYLHTSNHPPCDDLTLGRDEFVDWKIFKDWDEPCWEIYIYDCGSVQVHASRPTPEEAADGDLHGALGSEIRLRTRPDRRDLRNALRLSRMLCKCDPVRGLDVDQDDLVGITAIYSAIPVRLLRPSANVNMEAPNA
jgi:hypothetical protein